MGEGLPTLLSSPECFSCNPDIAKPVLPTEVPSPVQALPPQCPGGVLRHGVHNIVISPGETCSGGAGTGEKLGHAAAPRGYGGAVRGIAARCLAPCSLPSGASFSRDLAALWGPLASPLLSLTLMHSSSFCLTRLLKADRQ